MSAPAALAAVAVSVPLPAQRFYGRETELRDALLGWAARVEQSLGAAARQRDGRFV
jgi:hypothetical protein